MTPVYQQIRSNLVAIVSLLVALSTLGYTTWRHQVSEVNRTTREAAFEILRTAEALQTVVDFAHYEMDKQTGHPINGWEKVLYLRDMATLMPPSVTQRTDELHAVWAHDWDDLANDEAATQRITAAIENLRADVRAQLVRLR
jgi:hypothetical protein